LEIVDFAYALVGTGALLAAVLPRLVQSRPFSMPIAFLAFGMLVFALPVDLPDPDPLAHPELAEHLTEVGVLVALMGAGLRLDRPVGWRAWSSTWRLLSVAMLLTIATTAVLGWWWAGLAPASALLLGAVLAPTDPVLASEVQVGEPTEDEDSEDEVRFALTSEAGLNDALAFPFVYAAIAMAATGGGAGWVAGWFGIDVVYRLAAGAACGVAVGKLLGALFFRASSDALRIAKHGEGFAALAATFLAYGLSELCQGYGFLAVFVCGATIRSSERFHSYHQVMHEFVEQIERLLVVLLLLVFGGAIVTGLLEPLTWPAALTGLALLLVVRPASALVALHRGRGTSAEKAVIAAFGIRGIGSLYYVAYALQAADFPDAPLVWATVGFVVLVSVVVHGMSATAVMQRLDDRSRVDASGAR
jgi:NhaP-type Na+/H+ or K+/H+ antiporter